MQQHILEDVVVIFSLKNILACIESDVSFAVLVSWQYVSNRNMTDVIE